MAQPICASCGARATTVIRLSEPTDDGEAGKFASVCAFCAEMWLTDDALVGWCSAGGHAGPGFRVCPVHIWTRFLPAGSSS
jgi:hypothetical protein